VELPSFSLLASIDLAVDLVWSGIGSRNEGTGRRRSPTQPEQEKENLIGVRQIDSSIIVGVASVQAPGEWLPAPHAKEEADDFGRVGNVHLVVEVAIASLKRRLLDRIHARLAVVGKDQKRLVFGCNQVGDGNLPSPVDPILKMNGEALTASRLVG